MAVRKLVLVVAAENLSTNGPSGGVKEGETTTLEPSRLEQEALEAAAPLNDEKRKPVTVTVLKAAPLGTVNDNVKATFVLTLAGACVACWLTISASLRARSYAARNFMRPRRKAESLLEPLDFPI